MTTLFQIGIGLTLAATLFVAGQALAHRGPTPGEPRRFEELRSIGDVLNTASKAGRTVHIVYVHGMRADSSDASRFLRQALAASPQLKGFKQTSGQREVLWSKQDVAPAEIRHAGKPLAPAAVWSAAWERSKAFVIRTEFSNGPGFRVIVDEVNWWPLLMGLRCQALVGPDASLSGPRKRQIELCAKDVNGANGAADPYFPWIDPTKIPPRPPLGKGAFANRWAKQEVMNWGLADAVIALGPMRHYLRRAMDMAAARAIDDISAADESILIAESLGSFVAMDAAGTGRGPTLDLVRRTRHFYFLANQFALLELARIKGLPKSEGFVAGNDEAPSPLQTLVENAGKDSQSQSLMEMPTQIVAISDPSDALTFLVPSFEDEGIAVSNVQMRFSGGPFGILAHPIKAHRGAIEGRRRMWNYLLRPHFE